MRRVSSELELRSAFRSLDQDQLIFPATFKYPMLIKDYLTWSEPSGHRLYLVYPDGESWRGICFQRTLPAQPTTSMCQWCHTVRSGTGVGLLTATVTKDHRVGVWLCAHLNCQDMLAGAPSVHDLREGLSPQEKLERVMQRMRDFGRRFLF